MWKYSQISNRHSFIEYTKKEERDSYLLKHWLSKIKKKKEGKKAFIGEEKVELVQFFPALFWCGATPRDPFK